MRNSSDIPMVEMWETSTFNFHLSILPHVFPELKRNQAKIEEKSSWKKSSAEESSFS